jgi:hypothetical protein
MTFKYQPRPIELWAKRCELPLRGINSRNIVPPPAPAIPTRKDKKKWDKPSRPLQDNFVTSVCMDSEAAPVIIRQIPPHLIDNEVHRTIFDRAIGYFDKYGTVPGEGHLFDLVEKEATSSNTSKAVLYYNAICDILNLAKSINRNFVLDQLQEFVSQQYVRLAITTGAEELQRGNLREAIATLSKGIERAGNPQSGGLLEGIHPWRDFRKLTFDPVEDALFPTLQKPGITQIAGFRGEGKTWVALYMCVALANGMGVFGWKCNRSHRVLFVDGELPPWTLQERIEAVIADLGASPKRTREMLHVLSAYGSGTSAPINLADPQQTDALVEKFSQFDIVCWDNLSALTYGVDPNDAQSWESVNAVSMRCRGNGTSIVRIQHLGKDKSKGGRGSSRQEDPLDVSLVLERQQQDTFHANEVVRITCNKMRNHSMAEFEPIDLEFSKDINGRLQIAHEYAFDNKTDALVEKVMELMKAQKWKATNKKNYADKHGVARSTLYLAISKAEERLREQDKATDL